MLDLLLCMNPCERVKLAPYVFAHRDILPNIFGMPAAQDQNIAAPICAAPRQVSCTHVIMCLCAYVCVHVCMFSCVHVCVCVCISNSWKHPPGIHLRWAWTREAHGVVYIQTFVPPGLEPLSVQTAFIDVLASNSDSQLLLEVAAFLQEKPDVISADRVSVLKGTTCKTLCTAMLVMRIRLRCILIMCHLNIKIYGVMCRARFIID